MKKIIFILLASVFTGCGWIYQKKYRFNKPFTFQAKKDFIAFLEQKKWSGGFEFLYLDSISYFNFLQSSNIRNGNVVLQGMFVNDSVEVKPTDVYLQKRYCTGSILHEIERLCSRAEDSLLMQKSSWRISDYSFHSLKDNLLFYSHPTNEKIYIMLSYSYALGNYYDNLFEDIRKIAQQNSKQVEVYVICLDPVYQLK